MLASVDHHDKFFDETGALTDAARYRALSGVPWILMGNIGADGAILGNGPDQRGGLGGRTNAGNTAQFTIETDANVLRIFAMVSRQFQPDNYLMGVADLAHADVVTVAMPRFDLGTNEDRERHVHVRDGGVVVTFRRVE